MTPDQAKELAKQYRQKAQEQLVLNVGDWAWNTVIARDASAWAYSAAAEFLERRGGDGADVLHRHFTQAQTAFNAAWSNLIHLSREDDAVVFRQAAYSMSGVFMEAAEAVIALKEGAEQ